MFHSALLTLPAALWPNYSTSLHSGPLTLSCYTLVYLIFHASIWSTDSFLMHHGPHPLLSCTLAYLICRAALWSTYYFLLYSGLLTTVCAARPVCCSWAVTLKRIWGTDLGLTYTCLRRSVTRPVLGSRSRISVLGRSGATIVHPKLTGRSWKDLTRTLAILKQKRH